MKKHLNKVLWGIVMVVTLAITMAAGSSFTTKMETAARQRYYSQAVSSEAPEVDLSKPRTAVRTSAIKVYYYRVFNGMLQRRLWNRTYGKWEWSTWHDVQRAKK